MADTGMGQDCPADGVDPQVIKSPNDKKSYRHFKLANGVTVLLIHDPAVAAGLATDATQVCHPPPPSPGTAPTPTICPSLVQAVQEPAPADHTNHPDTP